MEKELENRIEEAGKKLEDKKVKILGIIFPLFGTLIRDKNPLHLNQEYAIKKGYPDRLAFGVMLEAQAEQRITDIQRESGTPYFYSGHQFNFSSNNAFPGDMLTLGISRLEEKEEDLILDLNARKKDGKLVYLSKAKLTNNRPTIEERTDNPIRTDVVDITKEQVNLFYRCLLIPQSSRVPYSFIASAIPKKLLDIATMETGEPQGVYRGAEFTFLNEPKLGETKTRIYVNGSPSIRQIRNRGVLYTYNFTGICYQEGKPIIKGDIEVGCGKEIKIEEEQ